MWRCARVSRSFWARPTSIECAQARRVQWEPRNQWHVRLILVVSIFHWAPPKLHESVHCVAQSQQLGARATNSLELVVAAPRSQQRATADLK